MGFPIPGPPGPPDTGAVAVHDALPTAHATEFGALIAAAIGFTPTGSVSATTVQAAIAETAAEAARLGWISVADYGASPSATAAANTIAFNAAIAYAKTFAVAGNSVTFRGPPPVYVPPGAYQLGVLATIDFPGFQLIGSGRFSTLLQLTGTGPHIVLGVYNPTPANWWYGAAQNWVVQNFKVHSDEWPIANDRNRTRTFLQDNGGGSGHFTGVDIQGCKVGFEATSGSDFTVIDDSTFDLCDLGAYVGIASEQLEITRSLFSRCVEGFVADWAPQGNIRGCWATSNLDADFVFQTDVLTRLGQDPTSLSGVSGEFMWDLKGLWLESDAGSRPIAPPRSILVRGTSPAVCPRYVHAEKLYVVAGAAAFSATAAIFEVQSGQRFSMKDVLIYGPAFAYAVKFNGFGGSFDLENLRTHDGNTPTAVLPYVAVNGGNLYPGAVYRDRWLSKKSIGNSGSSVTLEEWSRVDTDVNAIRLIQYGSGIIGWAFNSDGTPTGWLTRVKTDVQLGKTIFRDDTEVRRVIANVLGTGADDGFRTGDSTTALRPSAVTMGANTQWFDATLHKPIWSDGTVWRDALGTAV